MASENKVQKRLHTLNYLASENKVQKRLHTLNYLASENKVQKRLHTLNYLASENKVKKCLHTLNYLASENKVQKCLHILNYLASESSKAFYVKKWRLPAPSAVPTGLDVAGCHEEEGVALAHAHLHHAIGLQVAQLLQQRGTPVLLPTLLPQQTNI